MKMPRTPPKLLSPADLGMERAMELLAVAGKPTYKDRYVHWDKLRHLPMPPELRGFSSEEWWFGLKLARRFLLKDVPLRATDGRPFMYGTPDPVLALLQQLDRGTGGAVLSLDTGINRSMREEYVIRSLTEEAITSSQLEGAATTREVAKQMLRSGRTPRDVSEQMILNNYRAMEAIRARKAETLSPEFIFDLHTILTRDAMDKPDAVGRLRHGQENVRIETPYGDVLHRPPAAAELPERLKSMCEFANGKATQGFLHPIVRAIILHFWLAYDHPFVDGNGRCARALFYWSMLNSGYWLCEFVSISQVVRKAPIRYGRAFLYTESDDNDLTYFILYHLDVMHRAMDELHAYIQRKTNELKETEQLIRLRADLNHRQLALLGHALRHPDALYTIREHQNNHHVVYQTARTDLFAMAEKGYLIESRHGREYFFRPTPGLREFLGKG